MTTKKPATISIEKSLNELESLINKMESKELSLDESLKLFERGVTLTNTCKKILDEAKQKIEIISNDHPLADKK